MREQHPIDGHSQKRDGAGSVAPDLSLEGSKSCQVLCWTQFTNADTASCDDIGQPQPPLGEPPIFSIGERLIDQARIEEEFPKAVRGAREMVSHGG